MNINGLFAALRNYRLPQAKAPAIPDPPASGELHAASGQNKPVGSQRPDTWQPSWRSRLAPPPESPSRDKAPAKPDQYVPEQAQRPANADKFTYQRLAQMDYRLNLRFDLGVVSRTAQTLADGRTVNLRSMAQAGFGLHADMQLSGFEQIQQETGPARQAPGALAYRNRSHEADSFQADALDVRRRLSAAVRNAHRTTTSHLRRRYQFSGGMTFGTLRRFNVQTEQVNQQRPEALPDYLRQTGTLAEAGADASLSAYLDAVQSYLDEAESQIAEKVTTFFDEAAKELGFSHELVAKARSGLTSSVKSFFARVDKALDSIAGQFSRPPEPPSPAVAPSSDPARIYRPEADRLSALQATA